ncbi:FeoA family protein [Sphaerotilus sp.]|uniref:FeoA family protein n=1 Tax=Sphaerotilus sp. TaxID=2093942 RepID=UPI002ACD3C34|nr:FeoA family protein [Sphaerotilus sp.]MDZ7858216.1 FeoA family protein [Sphaerotilus sp.]
MTSAPLLLSLRDLPRQSSARIAAVVPRSGDDRVAQRLEELGFVPGERVRVIAHGPLGAEPIAVQLGFTRFALRRAEAERVMLEVASVAPGVRA